MLDSLSNFVEKNLAGPFVKLSRNRYIQAIQRGMMPLIAVTIIGSIYLVIWYLPIPGLNEVMIDFGPKLNTVVSRTMGLMALVVSFSIAHNLADIYKLETLHPSVFSAIAFLILSPNVEGGIPVTYLGATGMFSAILISIISVEIFRFFIKRNMTIKMPEGVPPMVANAFTSLIPGLVLITLVWVVRTLLSFNLNAWILEVMQPLVAAGDSIWSVILIVLMSRLLWFFGIHGGDVVGAVTNPFLLIYTAANADAVILGDPMPYVTSLPWYSCVLGWGLSTGVGIAIALLLMRSKSLKDLGKMAFPISLFGGIWEPMVFGIPVVLNPILFIPWVFSGVFMAIITWILTSINVVGRAYVNVPWTSPPIVGPYLATGGNIPAVIMQLVNILITVLFFYPFLKVIDKQRLTEKQDKDKSE